MGLAAPLGSNYITIVEIFIVGYWFIVRIVFKTVLIFYFRWSRRKPECSVC